MFGNLTLSNQDFRDSTDPAFKSLFKACIKPWPGQNTKIDTAYMADTVQ